MLKSRFSASKAMASTGSRPDKYIRQCKKVENICTVLEYRLRKTFNLDGIFFLPRIYQKWRPEIGDIPLDNPIITAIITDKKFDDNHGANTEIIRDQLQVMKNEFASTYPHLSFEHERMFVPNYGLNMILSHHLSLYTGHYDYRVSVRPSNDNDGKYMIDIYTPPIDHDMRQEDWIHYARDNAAQSFGPKNMKDLFGPIPGEVAALVQQAATYYFPNAHFALSVDSKERLSQAPITYSAGITPSPDDMPTTACNLQYC